MPGTIRRAGRLAVAMLLSGLLMVGALAGNAGAALGAFNAKSTAFALKVTIDLSGLPQQVKDQVDTLYSTAYDAAPAAAQALLPEAFPFSIEETFLVNTADASNQVTHAFSKLGVGTADLSQIEAVSEGDSKTHTEQALVFPPVTDAVDLGAVSTSVGNLSAKVTKGPVVDANSNLVSVEGTLESLNQYLPPELTAALDTILATVNEAVTTTTSDLNDALAGVEAQIEGLLAGTVPAGTPLDTVLDTVGANIPTITLPEVPNVLGTSLVTATALSSSANAEQNAAGGIVSVASADVAGLSVLGGFINVGVMSVKSRSESNGTTASNSAYCNVASARIGDVAGVSLDGTNLYVDVNGEPVALPVSGTEVGAVKSQVDTLLAGAGISVELCDEAKATKNGAAATQSVSAFKLTIEPKVPVDTTLLGAVIPAGQSLGVKIVIDPTVTTSVNAAPAAAAGAQLPRTGATTAVTMGLGLAIMATAVVLRRRAVAVKVRRG